MNEANANEPAPPGPRPNQRLPNRPPAEHGKRWRRCSSG